MFDREGGNVGSGKKGKREWETMSGGCIWSDNGRDGMGWDGRGTRDGMC